MEINESKLKEILNEQSDGFRHHVEEQMIKQREDFQRVVEKDQQEIRHLLGIMKEDFDSDVQLIVEQYGFIKEILSSLAKDMQIVKSDIKFIKEVLR